MKAMILSDFMTIRKLLVQQSVLCLIVGAFIDFLTQTIYATPMFTMFMMVLSLTFSIVSLDEANDWQVYRLALPLSRKAVVIGRYESIGLVVLLSTVLGMITSAVVLGISYLFPTFESCAAIIESANWSIYGVMVALSMLLCCLLTSLMLPICFRLGMTKAVRWIPLAATLAILLGCAAVGNNVDIIPTLDVIIEALASPMNTLWTIIAALALTVIVFLLSCAVSIQFYRTRQF